MTPADRERSKRLTAEFERVFFSDEAPSPIGWRAQAGFAEMSGPLQPFTERVKILPFAPYTRWQRFLHRLGIHQWHRHSQPLTLTLKMLDDLMKDLQ